MNDKELVAKYVQNGFTDAGMLADIYRLARSAPLDHCTYVCEIGCFRGRTTAFLVEAIQDRLSKVIVVDPFSFAETESKNAKGIITDFFDSIASVGGLSRVFPIISRSDNNILKVMLQGICLGLTIVDGSHLYEAAKNDALMIVERTVSGGYIFFHDFHPTYQGVKDAVEEVMYPLVAGGKWMISVTTNCYIIFQKVSK